ncbi:MFS transporter [Methyloversatilis sp.]|uniref:MFS transporter n=1 Tax=Methyloversatilis sp. TaxID=2569862 RepID=UPI0027335450|nr:MFS transporter [Methyloversatilis sp.]MDP2869630.1 MFS transporter [Methyloversatilis sp.]MDP3454582.1 MFS transporter [Methyloversatilis sp.]MDP3580208.1 MFS transporter [Methyloversatilis sp.]
MSLPYWRLSAYYFFYFAFVGAFSPYFGLYLSSIHFSAADIAIVMSLMQVMRILAPSLWGWLADRIGARVPIVRAAGLASLAGFLIFFTTDQFIGVFIAMALMSFFWSASLPLVEALTLEHLKSSVSRYGAIRVWGSIGFVVTVLVLGDVLERTGLDAVLWACSLLLAGIFLFAMCVPEAPVHAGAVAATQSLRTILRSRPVAGLFGAAFFMSCAHGALYVFYSIHLDEHGYSKRVIGGLWTLGVLAEIGVFLCMPWLLRRFTLRALLLAALVAAVLRFAVIGWAVSAPLWLIGAQLLHGLTFGAFHAGSVAALNQWFDARQQARAQALYGSVSFGAGGMVGGLLAGWMWAPLGGAWAFSVSALFAVAGYALLRRMWRPETAPGHG